jgi:predicted nucleic acid-binding Zn ribbon protein
MKCLLCGTDREEGQKYCPDCGSPVVRRVRRPGLRDFALFVAFIIVVVVWLTVKPR